MSAISKWNNREDLIPKIVSILNITYDEFFLINNDVKEETKKLKTWKLHQNL